MQNLWAGTSEYFAAFHLPQRVIHADLYLGNTVVDSDGNLVAVVDFDDCYTGTAIFDLGIATMSYSFVTDTTARWDLVRTLVQEFESARGAVDPRHVYMSILANCCRFYFYTLPLTLQNGEPAASNPFAIRAAFLADELNEAKFMPTCLDN